MSERQLQRQIRMYLRVRGFRSVHVPNGSILAGDATKRKIQGAMLKRDGLMPGFPDLLVYGPEGRVGHIEVKLEGGAMQETQKDVRRWMDEWGHKYAVCRSLEDVADTLKGWGWV